MPAEPAGSGASGEACTPEGSAAPTASAEILVRLTLSVLERGGNDRRLWSQPQVHRAVLVTGLSLLVAGQQRLRADLLEQA